MYERAGTMLTGAPRPTAAISWQCRVCGARATVEGLRTVWPQARDLNGFALERVDVVYRGTCATCREQRDSA
jgi:Fe2+ or Zn2+ uptake regulation protein